MPVTDTRQRTLAARQKRAAGAVCSLFLFFSKRQGEPRAASHRSFFFIINRAPWA
ncbi:hypothetical protein L3D22_15415 [Lysobacter soli]|uniref:hypothetical protein n=1 Tax=Lysobacter soli TaxID=453783 RepID=UPI00209E9FDA|nr:hypothetical protein [Lysobacter soli]UTA53707.1 hypothetical protein L3D22_15415 [Lysobacter soli]